MLSPRLQILHRTIKRLLSRGADVPLANVIYKTHPADVAEILKAFGAKERAGVLGACSVKEKQADILGYLPSDLAAQYILSIDVQEATLVLHTVPPDDLSDILECMPEDHRDRLLAMMKRSTRTEMEKIGQYEPSSAGGIMNPRVFSLSRDTTAAAAIEALRENHSDLEMVFYVYVINEVDQLLGVVSLRQLVTTHATTTLFELMTSEVISVDPEVDQEEVAKLSGRYGLLAIPVVDKSNKLLGIVTVDDVIDVMREEATEDILRMAGAGRELDIGNPWIGNVMQRLPALLAVYVSGLLSYIVISKLGHATFREHPLYLSIPHL